MADLFDRLKDRAGNLETTHRLREPCPCGETIGRISSLNGQDRVYCRNCGTFQYNAPRTETGREPRSLATVREIAPSQRYRVLERAHGRCELCASSDGLTIAHFLSVRDGFDLVTDFQLNSDDNLIALCAECNAGQAHRTGPLWLFAAIL